MRLTADVIGRLLQLIVLIALARRLDEAAFGTLMVGATAGLVVAQLADAGLSLIIGADVARREPTSPQAVASGLAAKVVLSVLGAAVLVTLYPYLGATPAAAGAVLIAIALSLDTYIQFAAAQFRAIGAYRLDWLTTLVPRVLSVLIVLPVVLSVPEPTVVGLAWLAAATVAAVTSLFMLRRRFTPQRPSRRVAVQLLARSWPIGASIVISMLYTRAAIFLLEGLRTSEDVAVYVVAMRLTEPMYVLPAAMTAVFYPGYARIVAESESAAAGMLSRWGVMSGGVGAIAFLGLAIFGVPVTEALFGDAYRSSGELLRLLGLVVVPGFMSFLLNQALIARGYARYTLVVMTTLLVFSVAANVWAIERYGVTGAAAVAVVVEVLLLAALAERIRRRVATNS